MTVQDTVVRIIKINVCINCQLFYCTLLAIERPRRVVTTTTDKDLYIDMQPSCSDQEDYEVMAARPLEIIYEVPDLKAK